jgi:hypothetical protein
MEELILDDPEYTVPAQREMMTSMFYLAELIFARAISNDGCRIQDTRQLATFGELMIKE